MKKILIPIDLSGESTSLVNYAVGFADQFKCQLIFFHSVMELVATGITKTAYEATVLSLIKSKQQLLIQKIAQNCKKQELDPSTLKTDYEVRFGGNVADNILEIANARNIDLIILSTHGSSGLKRFFFGSVTSDIISKAKVPVLAIPLRYKFRTIKQIIYATDLKNPVNELKQVNSLAKSLNTTVEALNFYYGEVCINDTFIKLLKSSKIDFIELKVNIEYTLLDQLRMYMKRKPDCILCMFTRHRTALVELFAGIRTRGMVKRLKFPLLSLPKD